MYMYSTYAFSSGKFPRGAAEATDTGGVVMSRENLYSVGRKPARGPLFPTALELPLPPAIGRLLTNLPPRGERDTKGYM